MQVNLNTNNISFGLKSNPNATKKALENVEPILKNDIVNGLNAFCDITQRRGIKGSVFLESLEGDILTYTLKPVKNGTPKTLAIDISKTRYHVPRRETIKRSFLESINYLFKS